MEERSPTKTTRGSGFSFTPKFAGIPFVCWQYQNSSLTDSCVQGAMQAAVILGASLCLNLAQVSSMSDEELGKAIESCLFAGTAAI